MSGSKASGDQPPKQEDEQGQPDPWITSQLKQLYDEVAAEPLPQDFLDLLDSIGKPKDEGKTP